MLKIGATNLDVHDVGLDELSGITDALQEEALEPVLEHHPLIHHLPPLPDTKMSQSVLRIRIRCLFDPWIRDPGGVKNKNPDPG